MARISTLRSRLGHGQKQQQRDPLRYFNSLLAPRSREDLKQIVSFIARHNQERARSFGHELIDRALAIGAFPELGRAVPEVNDPAVREVIYGPYRITAGEVRDGGIRLESPAGIAYPLRESPAVA